MPTQTVEFRAPTGLTLTAQVFNTGVDTIVQTASSVTEATNRKGTYRAIFTDPGASEFELIAFNGVTPVCRWFVTLTLTTDTFQAYEVKTQSIVAAVNVGSINANVITSSALAASAIAEIAAAAGVTVNVTPLQATEPDRITPSGIQTLINDLSAIGPIAIKDSSGDPVSLAGLTLKVCIERIDGTVLANLTPTISGASNNQITFTPNADSVAKTGTFRWALRQVSDGKVYGLGEFIVDSAAKIAP